MTLTYSERALRHLSAIYFYIAQDNEDAATRVIAGIRSAARLLASNPQLGREGRRQGTRELIHEKYILVYRVQREAVRIEAVLNRSRG